MWHRPRSKALYLYLSQPPVDVTVQSGEREQDRKNSIRFTRSMPVRAERLYMKVDAPQMYAILRRFVAPEG